MRFLFIRLYPFVLFFLYTKCFLPKSSNGKLFSRICSKLQALKTKNTDKSGRDANFISGGLIHSSIASTGSQATLLDYILAANPTMKRSNIKKYLSFGNVFVNGEPQSQFDLPLLSGIYKLVMQHVDSVFLN